MLRINFIILPSFIISTPYLYFICGSYYFLRSLKTASFYQVNDVEVKSAIIQKTRGETLSIATTCKDRVSNVYINKLLR